MHARDNPRLSLPFILDVSFRVSLVPEIT